MALPFPADPYMQKGFAPIRFECDYAHLGIEGALPRELDGTFYRIGPNPQFAPRGRYNPLHGDGMVHAFRLRNGEVSYRNRWIRTRQWTLERAAGRSLFGAPGDPTGTDPDVAGLQTDGVANTNLVWHGGRLLALEEGHGPIEIAPSSIDTIGPWHFEGALPGNMTAHPKIDPETGEMLFFANFPTGRLTGDIGFYVAGRNGALVRSDIVTGPFAALIHDFAVTAKYVVFILSPATVSIKRAREGGPPVAWEPGLGTHVGVLPRHGDAAGIRWFEGPPRMVWHTLNAFDEGGRITIDLCEQDAAVFPLADGTPPDLAEASQYLARWELDWDGPRTLMRTRLSGERCEYPRFDERWAGREHRHGYVACLGGPGSGDLFHRGIGHFDAIERRMKVWSAGPGQAVSEPVFVARDGGAEGQGYLLANVYDEALNASYLAVLDAEAVEVGPIARAWLDHRVPVGFHALWKPTAG